MTRKSFAQVRSRWWGRAGVAGALLVMPLALMVGVVPAQAQTPGYSVSLDKSASLQLNGRAVLLKAYVTCPAGSTVSLTASLAQRINKTSVINISSQRPVYCTGSSRKEFVSVVPNAIGLPSYKLGDAIASAYVSYCDENYNCYSSPTTARTVSVSTVSFASYTDATPRISATLGKTGKLRASGAGVIIPVTITCSNVSSAGVSVTVSHWLKQNFATDYGGSPTVTCNSQKRVVQVLLVVNSYGYGGIPFVVGPAFAVAGVSACDQDGSNCQSVVPQGVVTLQR